MNIVLEGQVEAFGSSRAHASSFLCWYVNFPHLLRIHPRRSESLSLETPSSL